MEEDSSSAELSSDEYYVEKVLDKKIIDDEQRYLIKWEGWPMESSTWEPIENLGNIKNLIDEFEKTRKDKSPGNILKNEKFEDIKKSMNSYQIPKKKLNSNDNKFNRDIKQETGIMLDIGINVPQEIISCKNHPEHKILCLVKFKERNDGTTISDAYVPSFILKMVSPKILIKFYESKIQFVNKK